MIERIIVHCSASPQGRGDNAGTIHQWHLERGWSGIGYHAVILEDGTIERGRPDYWMGSHTHGHNAYTLGVCLIGMGGDATQDQLDALEGLIREWRHKHGDLAVFGHRDFAPAKTCPGFDAGAWWESVA
jgi:N-acetylmuramoyl-L-alanine amidase